MPTDIQWTDETWNPVTGCTRVSPGCANCYIERTPPFRMQGRRFARVGNEETTGVRLHPDRLEQPLRWRKPRRVFVCSLADLFHDDVPDEFILAVWAVMEAAPQHVYQVLTKRPERMRALLGTERPPTPPKPPYERRMVIGYPGYEIDTEGNVWAKRDGRQMRAEAGLQGYQRVQLYIDGVARHELVHRLVLGAFDRIPFPGEQGCHRDGDASHNAIENLYWGTQADNWADRHRHGNSRSHSKVSPVDVADLRRRAMLGESAASLGRAFGISDTQARNIIRGDQWNFKTLPSVWLGVSIENARYTWRADVLREIPAAVRFISAEPLLGSLYLEPAPSRLDRAELAQRPRRGRSAQIAPAIDDAAEGGTDTRGRAALDLTGMDWIIVGGESGPGARPFHLEHAREIIREARSLPFIMGDNPPAIFVKQLGAWPVESGERYAARVAMGVECEHGYDVCPECDAADVELKLRDRKGGDIDEFPPDLRVREFPRPAGTRERSLA